MSLMAIGYAQDPEHNCSRYGPLALLKAFIFCLFFYDKIRALCQENWLMQIVKTRLSQNI